MRPSGPWALMVDLVGRLVGGESGLHRSLIVTTDGDEQGDRLGVVVVDGGGPHGCVGLARHVLVCVELCVPKWCLRNVPSLQAKND